MVFSSHLFLFYFLPLTLLGYYLLPRAWRNLFLTLASYVFYGWANPLFSLLMLFSTTIDYVDEHGMSSRKTNGSGIPWPPSSPTTSSRSAG